MENNDKLLKQFFDEQRQQPADNGFTRRVMHRLPHRSKCLDWVWTSFCTTLAIALFWAMDGVQTVLDALRETFTSAAASSHLQVEPYPLVAAFIVLLCLGGRKIASSI